MHLARSWTVAAVLWPLLVWAAPTPPPAPPAGSEPEAPGEESPGEEAPGADEEPQPSFHWQQGPRQVELGHELTLDVPAEHIFLERDEAAKLLEANGSFYNDNLLGVVAGADEHSTWIVVVRYEDEGYVKDTEAIDSQEVLKAIREGTEEANKERVEKGFKPLHVSDWTEAPHYDKTLHHLIWALSALSDEGESVNYSTRVLGRKGYASMNLVVKPQELAASKPEVARLLGDLHFKPGARYEDFQDGTDKVAEFGLAGLILGGAGLGAAQLVKVGLLAKAWKLVLALLLAGKKLVVVLFAGIAASVRRLFGRKRTEEVLPSTTPDE